MLDKNLHELMMKLGDNSNSNRGNSNTSNDIEPVEFKIWERNNNGVLVSRPVKSVHYMDSNVSNEQEPKNSSGPIITELGGGSRAGSSVSNPNQSNNNINDNINKAKVIHNFIASKGKL